MRSQQSHPTCIHQPTGFQTRLISFAIAASLVTASSVWAQDPGPSAESLSGAFPKAPLLALRFH
jgi:hypothetical protein